MSLVHFRNFLRFMWLFALFCILFIVVVFFFYQSLLSFIFFMTLKDLLKSGMFHFRQNSNTITFDGQKKKMEHRAGFLNPWKRNIVSNSSSTDNFTTTCFLLN